MGLEQILAPNLMHALGWALVHSLWQGAMIALLLALSFTMFQKIGSKWRYRLLISSLCFIFILFLGTFAKIFYTAIALEKTPNSITVNVEIIEKMEKIITTETIEKHDFWTIYTNYFNEQLPIIVGFWLLGMAVFTLQLLAGLTYIQRLRYRQHTPMSFELEALLESIKMRFKIKQKVALVESKLAAVPMVIGYLKPMILMPIGILNHLTINEVEAILAHELAHIKRYDYLVNLLQSIIETILFFHPAVWWISGEIRREREHCCDDLALQITNNLTLAKALANLETFKIKGLQQQKSQLSMAAMTNKNQLLNRIKRILNQPQKNNNRMKGLFAAGILTICFIATSLDARQVEVEKTLKELPLHKEVVTIGNTAFVSITDDFSEITIKNLSKNSMEVLSKNLSITDFPIDMKPNIQDKNVLVFRSKDSNIEKLMRINILQDTSINGEIHEINIIRTVKDSKGDNVKLEIKTKKESDIQTVEIFANGKKLTKENQKQFQKWIDESVVMDSKEVLFFEYKTENGEIEKLEMERDRAKQLEVEVNVFKREKEAIADERRAIAEAKMRIEEDKIRIQQAVKQAEAEMQKVENEEMATLRKKQAAVAKELAEQRKRLAEAKEDEIRTVKMEMNKMIDLSEKLAAEQREIQKRHAEVAEIEIGNEWLSIFKTTLINDGIIKKDTKNLTIKMVENEIKVNGKRLTPEQEKKYFELYEKVTGNPFDKHTTVEIEEN